MNPASEFQLEVGDRVRLKTTVRNSKLGLNGHYGTVKKVSLDGVIEVRIDVDGGTFSCSHADVELIPTVRTITATGDNPSPIEPLGVPQLMDDLEREDEVTIALIKSATRLVIKAYGTPVASKACEFLIRQFSGSVESLSPEEPTSQYTNQG